MIIRRRVQEPTVRSVWATMRGALEMKGSPVICKTAITTKAYTRMILEGYYFNTLFGSPVELIGGDEDYAEITIQLTGAY